jgi:hypothetical protein
MSKLTALVVAICVFVVGAPMTALAQTTSTPPAVHLDSYTGKPTRSFSVSGSGFAPGESVDVCLVDQATTNLATVTADGRGDVASQNLTIPSLVPGNYRLVLVGQTSQTPASVGFNVQGFHPWVVLDNYYIAPRAGVGFRGEDFIPGEPVQVYLNTRLSPPVAQVTADSSGHFAVNNAFGLPDVTGDNALIFVGQQSQTEVTATFAAAASELSRP